MASMQSLATALQNRVKTLGARFNEAKTKLNDLAKKLNESSEASGENSEETQKLAAQFAKAEAEVQKLGTQLVNAAKESANADERLEELKKAAEGAADGVEDVSESSEELGDTLEESGSKVSMFGELLKANLASDAIKAGVKKLASAVVEVGKASLEAYGDYEQLADGAQLMFGDAYATVAENAKNAYKTVQMSQNDYLQQVNGFATGLKTALGGNEQAAADLAHKIVVAEADVVAATGNTQEAVQNAFNGIMRSNYTMLDNLQLGITPTKEGFQELIDKVNDWNAANGKSTSYTIDNLADCQSALVDYIEMQGLAGYAGMEAADTIQGSTASMKAAWENLSTGMADETADMEQLTQDFVDSVGTAAKNILPRVQQIVTGVGTATVEGISYLRETNDTIDTVISVVDDLGIVAAATGAVLTVNFAGQKAQAIITAFTTTAKTVSALTVEEGKAAVASAALNGTFSVGEVVVGVLTGKISLATAAQYAWNTAMNANPIGVVIALVSALGIAVSKSRKHISELADGYVEQADSAAECAANLEKLKARYAELTGGQRNPNKWAAENRTEIAALGQAIEETEQQLYDLTDAETAAAIASGEMSAKTLADAEAIQTAAETYSESVQQIIDDYYKTFQNVYDGLHNTASAFTEVVTATEITWADAMSNIDQNTQFLERMDDNMTAVSNAADAAGINIDGFKQMLSTMGAADAAGLVAALAGELEKVGANSTDAAAILENLSTATERYANAGTDAASIMAVAVSDVDTQLAESLKNYTQTVEGFDQSAEAIEAAINTMEGLISGFTSESPAVLTEVEGLIDQIETELDASAEAKEAGVLTMDGLASGIESSTSTVLSKVDSLASQMKSRLQSSFSSFVLNISANVTATNGSHKSGLDYVPFDGYIAELHKGERVLTAEEASAYRAGKDSASGGGGFVINQYIQTPVETPAELAAATEAYFQQARWAVAL